MQGYVQSSAWQGSGRVSVQLNTGQVHQGHRLWIALRGTLFSLRPTAAVEATSREPQAGEEGIAPPFQLSSADFLRD